LSCGKKTGICTTRAAGVGVQARRERFAEITPGRATIQQRLVAICKDPPAKGDHRRWEDRGLAHESVVAKRAG